jgi:glutathione S-transferase
MAIHASGLQVELREVVLRDKPASMLEASPKGTVPVLVLPGGSVLEESRDIMMWALEQQDLHGWLKGDGAETAALIDRCDDEFKYHLDRYKYATRYDGAVSEEHRQAAENFLRELESRLAKAPYLLGEQARLPDYAIMPFIRQFANTDKAWFEAAPYPHVRRWLDALLTAPPFTEIMAKYSQWHDGDAPVLFPA